ncbi:DUF3995 domain-containing protein [Arthrobacter sp. ZBG10]|uniref:DUF3995 domain-containing protein n=1 Tax=Arthrobacter sp. ZBG10 TaxID=1676590 RepID=UPI000682DF90|nr:DUF3995 domain-containing protein [Arthrobacter sp. ZBG10]
MTSTGSTNTGRRTSEHSARIARIAVVTAFCAGVLHAASSFYWAFGGRWLLATVGAWAVEAAEDAPAVTGLVLGAVGLVKLLAAVIPLVVAAGRAPWPRLWRVVCWAGAPVLVVYGGLNIAVSGAVLLGATPVDGGFDRAAMAGHVFLWDPLFLIWGVALMVWLLCSRAPESPSLG